MCVGATLHAAPSLQDGNTLPMRLSNVHHGQDRNAKVGSACCEGNLPLTGTLDGTSAILTRKRCHTQEGAMVLSERGSQRTSARRAIHTQSVGNYLCHRGSIIKLVFIDPLYRCVLRSPNSGIGELTSNAISALGDQGVSNVLGAWCAYGRGRLIVQRVLKRGNPERHLYYYMPCSTPLASPWR